MPITPSIDAQAGSSGQNYDPTQDPNTSYTPSNDRVPTLDGGSIPRSLYEMLDPQVQIALTGTFTARTIGGGTFTQAPVYSDQALPVITQQQLQGGPRQFGGLPAGGGGGGGGGGGAAAPKPPVFDRASLAEAVREAWRTMLLEEPLDSEVDAIVSGYISEATAFWSKGGNLGFEAFLLSRLRSSGRYAVIYRAKPPGVTEQQFLAPFVGAVSPFGLRPAEERRQLIRSVTSGGSPAGQQQRIAGTRHVQNQGGWSQRLAATVQSLGSF